MVLRPSITGMNVINPLAAIGALGILLETLGEEKAATLVDQAIAKVTGEKLKSTIAAGKMGYSTSEVGDMVARLVAIWRSKEC